MGYLAFFCRAVIGAVFVLSAFSKVSGRTAFANFITTTRVLLDAMQDFTSKRLVIGPSLTRGIGLAVVGVEICTPILLALPGTVSTGFAASGLLLVFLSVAISAAVREKVAVGCRCFGSSSTSSLGLRHLVRNALLAVVAFTGLAAQLTGSGPVSALVCVPIVLTAAVMVALVVGMDDVLALFGRHGDLR